MHVSKKYIDLRWHKKGEARSFPERFYIVDGLETHVELGSTANNDKDLSKKNVHVLGLEPQTAGK